MNDTEFFYSLGIEKVLDAVELAGVKCTGRCLVLNSMENRVYEVEIVVDHPEKLRSPSERFRIAKFYRPGRWSQEQILEEHEFLLDLQSDEIPVIAPLPFASGETLKKVPGGEIWFALFPKKGGRAPDELDDLQLQRFGRLLARMHNVGASKVAKHRLRLDPTSYGLNNLKSLIDGNWLPADIKSAYQTTVEELCTIIAPWFQTVSYQRIHGDCHFSNILWNDQGPFLLDFDDMLSGPCVQDIWLMLPGRDEPARLKRDILLAAYEMMRPFDYSSLRLIEPLRALRYIHYSTWIAKRWQDPAFPRAFPTFVEKDYWPKQLADLREQLQIIKASA